MLQKFKENKDKFIYGAGAGLTTALVAAAPVLAEGDSSASASSTILSEFTTAAGDLKTLLIGVIGVSMSIITLKLVFKGGVSFFKSAASK